MSNLPRVTDHAVLRYLERAKGFDIESVRSHIATLCAGAVNSGASTMHAEGVKFEFTNRSVVTVSPGGGYSSRTHRRRLIARAGA